MNLTEFTFRKSRIFLFASLAVVIAGIAVYWDYPSQEEPTIPIREAVAYALYPGMATRQMEDLVARPMEERIRELSEVKKIQTRVRTGMVLVTVTLDDRYTHLQPIWQRLRAKMRDAETALPAGTQGPFVDDDYGRVAVASIAFTAPGFSPREIRDSVKHFRDRLYALPGVDRISIHGLDDEVVYLETDNAELARTGFTPARLLAELHRQNIILPGGEIETGGIVASVAPTGSYHTLDDIRQTPITLPDGRAARLGDMVKVSRGLPDPPRVGAFYDGIPAVVLAVSMAPGRSGAWSPLRCPSTSGAARLPQLSYQRCRPARRPFGGLAARRRSRCGSAWRRVRARLSSPAAPQSRSAAGSCSRPCRGVRSLRPGRRRSRASRSLSSVAG
jgi:multidrug efflux pump subunit AcrB